jgi:SAM-dependent methyltransferase
MADITSDERRLAQLYDLEYHDRSDLDVYAAMASEFGARSVLDIGCGTGTFACLLAARGLTVTGVDPDAASLEVARAKTGADQVRWIHGYAADLPDLEADLATMTANVAQAIFADEDWDSTLRAAFARLRSGGRLVFETRDPAMRAWLTWTREESYDADEFPGFGIVERWFELIEVADGLVTFRGICVFPDGTKLTSTSSLRFRTRAEVVAALTAIGYVVDEIRDAPDRPGRELVFIARRP